MSTVQPLLFIHVINVGNDVPGAIELDECVEVRASALLTPSKESTLARTKSTVNTFLPKSTNSNQSLGSITLGTYRMSS
jgi:hypothetical protein